MYHKRQQNIGWTPMQGQPPNRCLAAGLIRGREGRREGRMGGRGREGGSRAKPGNQLVVLYT